MWISKKYQEVKNKMHTKNPNIDKKEILIRITILIVFSLFTWMWSEKNNGVIASILGGIEIEDDLIKTLNLGKWLFLFAVYFLMLDNMMEDNRKIILFSLYRYGNFKEWWKQCFMKSQIKMFFYYSICCIVWYLIEIVTNNYSKHVIPIMITFYIHIAMFFCIVIAANQIFKKSIMPCILILVEGLSYIVAVQYPSIVLTYGMYCRMTMVENKWFHIIVLVIEFIVCYLSYFSVIWLWKKDRLELAR